MSLFQILALPLVAALFVRSVVRLARGGGPRAVVALGAASWLLAGVAIVRPELTIRIAKVMGIGRGADLVLYFFVIAFLAAFFYFYNTILKIRSDISKVVRHLAIAETFQHMPRETQAVEGKKAASSAEPLLHHGEQPGER